MRILNEGYDIPTLTRYYIFPRSIGIRSSLVCVTWVATQRILRLNNYLGNVGNYFIVVGRTSNLYTE